MDTARPASVRDSTDPLYTAPAAIEDAWNIYDAAAIKQRAVYADTNSTRQQRLLASEDTARAWAVWVNLFNRWAGC